MANDAIPGVIQIQQGDTQGPAPAGVTYIYAKTDGSVAFQNLTGGEVLIGLKGLRLKESHVMLSLSETEIAVP